MEKNAFSGPFGVISFQCDNTETNRVIDYCGKYYVVSGASNKLIRIWDTATGKVC